MKIAVLGYPSLDIIMNVNKFEGLGKTTLLLEHELDHHPGGCGLNISVGLKLLYDVETFPITTFGTDLGYVEYRDHLLKLGVKLDYIEIVNGKGAYSMIFNDPTGEQLIFYYPGVSEKIHIPEDYKADDFDYLIVTISPWDSIDEILRRSKNKTKILWSAKIDPASVSDEKLSYICKNVNNIVMNEREANHLLKTLKIPKFQDLFHINEDLEWMIITRGKNGATLIERNSGEIGFPPSKVEKPVDPTGAGDGFVVGLMGELSKSNNVEKAVGSAMEIASQVIKYKGAQTIYEKMRRG